MTDNGKPQKISTFTYSDIEAIQTAGEGDDNGTPVVVAVDTPRGDPLTPSAIRLRDRRMLVLYFDFTSLETQDLFRARDAALKFVRTQMSKADLVSVVIFDQKLSVWCDFTNDHAKIEKAVQQVTPGVAAQLADNSYAPRRTASMTFRRITKPRSPPIPPNSTSSTPIRNSRPSKDCQMCSARFPAEKP